MLNKKWIIVLAGAWAAAMVTFFILGKTTFRGDVVPVLPPIEVIELEKEGKRVDSGPTSDLVLENVENAEQTVSRFLQVVNLGNYDDAAGLIEPNVLINYTSEYKDISVREAVLKFVKLFDAGAAKKITVSNRTWDGYYYRVKAYVEYDKGQDTFTFYLREFDDKEHGTNPAYWYILKIEN